MLLIMVMEQLRFNGPQPMPKIQAAAISAGTTGITMSGGLLEMRYQ